MTCVGLWSGAEQRVVRGVLQEYAYRDDRSYFEEVGLVEDIWCASHFRGR